MSLVATIIHIMCIILRFFILEFLNSTTFNCITYLNLNSTNIFRQRIKCLGIDKNEICKCLAGNICRQDKNSQVRMLGWRDNCLTLEMTLSSRNDFKLTHEAFFFFFCCQQLYIHLLYFFFQYLGGCNEMMSFYKLIFISL